MDKKEREKLENLYDEFVELCKKYSLAEVLITGMFFLDGLVRITRDINITIEDLQKAIVVAKRKEEGFEDIKNET